MQAISDHFYWIIVLLGAIHAAGFVALLQARNRRVRQLDERRKFSGETRFLSCVSASMRRPI